MGDIELLSARTKALLKSCKNTGKEAGKIYKKYKKATSTRNIKLQSHNIFGWLMLFL